MTHHDDILLLQPALDRLKAAGRYDLLLQAIGVPALEQLNIEAARERLSPLVITADFRFILASTGSEVLIPPIHKALYLLYLNHPEGIAFKRLSEHRDELTALYRRIGNRTDQEIIDTTVLRLVNPLDNSVNEKCSRIKAAFAQHLDPHQLHYYTISGHPSRHFASSSRLWYDRSKAIALPRHLLRIEF